MGARYPAKSPSYLIVGYSAGIGLFFEASPSKLYFEDALFSVYSPTFAPNRWMGMFVFTKF